VRSLFTLLVIAAAAGLSFFLHELELASPVQKHLGTKETASRLTLAEAFRYELTEPGPSGTTRLALTASARRATPLPGPADERRLRLAVIEPAATVHKAIEGLRGLPGPKDAPTHLTAQRGRLLAILGESVAIELEDRVVLDRAGARIETERAELFVPADAGSAETSEAGAPSGRDLAHLRIPGPVRLTLPEQDLVVTAAGLELVGEKQQLEFAPPVRVEADGALIESLLTPAPKVAPKAPKGSKPWLQQGDRVHFASEHPVTLRLAPEHARPAEIKAEREPLELTLHGPVTVSIEPGEVPISPADHRARFDAPLPKGTLLLRRPLPAPQDAAAPEQVASIARAEFEGPVRIRRKGQPMLFADHVFFDGRSLVLECRSSEPARFAYPLALLGVGPERSGGEPEALAQVSGNSISLQLAAPPQGEGLSLRRDLERIQLSGTASQPAEFRQGQSFLRADTVALELSQPRVIAEGNVRGHLTPEGIERFAPAAGTGGENAPTRAKDDSAARSLPWDLLGQRLEARGTWVTSSGTGAGEERTPRPDGAAPRLGDPIRWDALELAAPSGKQASLRSAAPKGAPTNARYLAEAGRIRVRRTGDRSTAAGPEPVLQVTLERGSPHARLQRPVFEGDAVTAIESLSAGRLLIDEASALIQARSGFQLVRLRITGEEDGFASGANCTARLKRTGPGDAGTDEAWRLHEIELEGAPSGNPSQRVELRGLLSKGALGQEESEATDSKEPARRFTLEGNRAHAVFRTPRPKPTGEGGAAKWWPETFEVTGKVRARSVQVAPASEQVVMRRGAPHAGGYPESYRADHAGLLLDDLTLELYGNVLARFRPLPTRPLGQVRWAQLAAERVRVATDPDVFQRLKARRKGPKDQAGDAPGSKELAALRGVRWVEITRGVSYRDTTFQLERALFAPKVSLTSIHVRGAEASYDRFSGELILRGDPLREGSRRTLGRELRIPLGTQR
jgi:hypothetical protein